MISYIIILLIPLALTFMSYKMSREIVKGYINNSNLFALNQAKNIMDQQIAQISTISYQISNDVTISKMINAVYPLDISDYYEFKTAINNFSNYGINQDLFDNSSVYILLNNTDYILTPFTLYPADLYYKSVLGYDINNYQNWRKFLSDRYHFNTFISSDTPNNAFNDEGNVIFIQSLPVNFLQKANANLIINIKKEKLINLFSPSLVSSQGIFLIQNKVGKNILTISNSDLNISTNNIDFPSDSGYFTKKIDNKEYIVTYTTSTNNSWRYVSLVPAPVIFSKLNDLKQINYLIISIDIIIGILFALFLTYRNSKPIITITNELGEFLDVDLMNQKDAYDTIKGGISRLIKNNLLLKDSMENQKPFIKSTLLRNLLAGNFYSETELEALSSYLGINLNGNMFSVMLIRIYNDDLTSMNFNKENIEEINIWKAIVRSVLIKYFGNDMMFIDNDNRTIVLLFNLEAEEITWEDYVFATEKIFQAINEDLYNAYNMSIYIGIGNLCNSTMEIWHSFEQAQQALSFAVDSNTLIWYEHINKSNEVYYYPLEFEQRFINYAKFAYYEQIEKLIDMIYTENFSIRNLSIYMRKELLLEVRSTLNKLYAQILPSEEISSRIKNIGSFRSIEENFIAIKKIYKDICELFSTQKISYNLELVNDIKSYIDNNYTDTELGLYKISSHFNLSEGYFSYLFKEQTGVNFTEYLEKVRLEEACNLLKNTDEKIDKISLMVGYNSDQSFRRAFKKIYGVSPTALRKNP